MLQSHATAVSPNKTVKNQSVGIAIFRKPLSNNIPGEFLDRLDPFGIGSQCLNGLYH